MLSLRLLCLFLSSLHVTSLHVRQEAAIKTNATSNASNHAHALNSQESKFKQLSKSASSYLLRIDDGLAKKFSNFTFAKAYAASLEQDVKRYAGCNSTPEFDNYFPTNTATWGLDSEGCAKFQYVLIPGNRWPGGMFCYTSVSLTYLLFCVIATDPLYMMLDLETFTYEPAYDGFVDVPTVPRYFAISPPGLKCSEMGYFDCYTSPVVIGTDTCVGDAGRTFITGCLQTPPPEVNADLYDPDACGMFQQRITLWNERKFCREDHHHGFHNYLGPQHH